MKRVRILVADDHELVRRGLAVQLSQNPAWTVVAEAGNGLEAVEQALRLKPDLVVLDLSMPRLNGLSATRRILAADPAARILILTVHESEQLAREVLAAGALGYLLKSDAGRTLIAALEALIEGRPYFTSKVGRMVLDGYLHAPGARSGTQPELSARELEVVQLLAEGNSNKDVAKALGISVKTAETHRSNIMRKTGFSSLADLVRFAVRNGIIEA